MNDHIGLVFFGNTFRLSNGSALFAVFGGDPLIALSTYGPIVLIGYHMLVPGTAPGLGTRAFKNGIYQLPDKL
jgi:hypothetical protein